MFGKKGLWWMRAESTLAKMISTAGEKAAYDNACKRLLANKIILAWIMKSCLEEYRDCGISEIASKYIEGEAQISEAAVHPDEEAESLQITGLNTEDSTINEGTVTYDIRFRAIVPDTGERISLIINVEAQNDFYPGYPIVKRNLYYCCRLVSSQYGTEFTNSHYEKIKKVYSIFICMNPPNYRKNTINQYSIQEEFNIKMTQELEREVSEMCNLSERVEQKGIEKGIAKGRTYGIVEGIATSIRNLMESMGWSIEQAMDALQIPTEERNGYLNMLKK